MNNKRLEAMAWWNQLTPDEKLKYSPAPDSLTGSLIERIFFDKNRIDEKFNSYYHKYDKIASSKIDKYILYRKDPFTDKELEPFVSSCPRIIAGYYLATIQNTHDAISVEKNGSPMMLEELRVILKNFSSDLGV